MRIKYFSIVSCIVVAVAILLSVVSMNQAAASVDETVFSATEEYLINSTKVFDYIDIDAFKKNNYLCRDLNRETLNSYVFLSKNGSYTIYSFNENIKFVSSDGSIKEKDLTLVKTKEGFKTKENDISLFVPNKIQEGIALSFNDARFTITPAGVDNSYKRDAVIDRNIAIYEDVFGEGETLYIIPELSGFREEIIINSPVEKNSWSFDFETDDLTYDISDAYAIDAEGKWIKCDITINKNEKDGQLIIDVDSSFLNDKNTIYPVTIDPSITISAGGNTSVSGIWDAPVFQNIPNGNFGGFYYNTIGKADNVYGVGRCAIRLKALENSIEFSSISAENINSAKMVVKESPYFDARTVDVYMLNDNISWTENSVTWNNVGTYSTDILASATLKHNEYSEIDITDIAKKWKSENYSTFGLLIKLRGNEGAAYTQFDSANVSNTSYRPYLEVNITPYASFTPSSVEVAKDCGVQISATMSPSNMTTSWQSMDTNIATVTRDGFITGRNPGSTWVYTLTYAPDGTPLNLYIVNVYVHIADGLYRIKNVNSGMYLTVKDQNCKSVADVVQNSIYDNDTVNKASQQWIVKYLGDHRFSIRSLLRNDRYLDVTGGIVDVFADSGEETLESLLETSIWAIEKESGSGNKLIIKNNADTSKTMYIYGGRMTDDALAIVGNYANADEYKWELEPEGNRPSYVGFFNLNTGHPSIITQSTVVAGSDYTLSDLGFGVFFVGMDRHNVDEITWSVTVGDSVAVNANSGVLTALHYGNSIVVGSSPIGMVQYYVSVNTVPDMDAQNKTSWCWAACVKKVGTHNNGCVYDAGVKILPPTEEDGLHSINEKEFFGRPSDTQYSVDNIQYNIVSGVFGTGENQMAMPSDIMAALQNITPDNMSIGKVGNNGLDASQYNTLVSEIQNGNWVIASMGKAGNGHDVVIMDFNGTIFTAWDPWSNTTFTFYGNQVYGSADLYSIDVNRDYKGLKLRCFYYCHES